jgi:hypothetical protein
MAEHVAHNDLVTGSNPVRPTNKEESMIHFIPYVNNFELLKKAYSSCRHFLGQVIVIDNRDTQSNEPDPELLDFSTGHGVYTPPVPLTTAQSMNLMWRVAQEAGLPFFTWQHSDAWYEPKTLDLLYDIAQRSPEGKWGIIYTYHDTLAAYNTSAITAVGGWDYLRFPWYFLDNDISIRLEKKEYVMVQAVVGDVHHESSSTIHTSSERAAVNAMLFPISERLFLQKHPDYRQYGQYFVEVSPFEAGPL